MMETPQSWRLAVVTTLPVVLSRQENQARGIGQYALDFLAGRLGEPSPRVLELVERFHLDSVACGVAALATRMNAPLVLRSEALTYRASSTDLGAHCLGSYLKVRPEKAVLANCAAVRELDANGTNFGYDPTRGAVQGEFGHNDFYPVVMAAAEQGSAPGRLCLRAMLCLDEIRGRLAEVFALRRYKIDHVLHGAIASAAVYGAMLGASAAQIESAIGMVVAHHVPFRAIRHGHQLSDSKGASAAISAEEAVVAVHRALRGFQGPSDIFRNPQAVFRLFEPGPEGQSPFDLQLGSGGDDFAITGMHFKLGLYEHQSAGAIQGLLDLLAAHPGLLESSDQIHQIQIELYEPAFGIIGDPAKRDPHNRQSADHSMIYIVGRLLAKAIQARTANWSELMLLPTDYNDQALFDPLTRSLMAKIALAHGGPEFDSRYPDGIPTRIAIQHRQLGTITGELVMYPLGHARNRSPDFPAVFARKFQALAGLAVEDPDALWQRLVGLEARTPHEIRDLYSFRLDHAWIS